MYCYSNAKDAVIHCRSSTQGDSFPSTPTVLLTFGVAAWTAAGCRDCAKVVVSDIDASACGRRLTSVEKKAKDIAESINSNGGRALDVPGDMLDAANYIDQLVKKAAEFGFTWDGVIHKVEHASKDAAERSNPLTLVSDNRQAVGHHHGAAYSVIRRPSNSSVWQHHSFV